MLDFFALEGNGFVNAEFACQLIVIVLAFYHFVLAETAVGIGVADFTGVERESILFDIA